MKIETFSHDKYHYINIYNGCVRVGKLGIEDRGDNKVHINYVVTNLRYVGKGIATLMINKAIEMFKEREISLMVKPMPRSGENIKYATVKGLVSFYEKFGFKKTDDPILTIMVRKPTLPTLGV